LVEAITPEPRTAAPSPLSALVCGIKKAPDDAGVLIGLGKNPHTFMLNVGNAVVTCELLIRPASHMPWTPTIQLLANW
jgi:hypothetical protein